jgi:hypothetical protein
MQSPSDVAKHEMSKHICSTYISRCCFCTNLGVRVQPAQGAESKIGSYPNSSEAQLE